MKLMLTRIVTYSFTLTLEWLSYSILFLLTTEWPRVNLLTQVSLLPNKECPKYSNAIWLTPKYSYSLVFTLTHHGVSEILSSVVRDIQQLPSLCQHHDKTIHSLLKEKRRKLIFENQLFCSYFGLEFTF